MGPSDPSNDQTISDESNGNLKPVTVQQANEPWNEQRHGIAHERSTPSGTFTVGAKCFENTIWSKLDGTKWATAAHTDLDKVLKADGFGVMQVWTLLKTPTTIGYSVDGAMLKISTTSDPKVMRDGAHCACSELRA